MADRYIRPSRLGPPRFVLGWRAYHAEIARQHQLIASGDLRGLAALGWGLETVGWSRVEHFKSRRSKGVLMWTWRGSGHSWGGVWPKRSDREAAWEAALKQARAA